MTTINYTTRPCTVCGHTTTVPLDADAYTQWKNGAYVQDAFRSMSADERELLISGTHSECWAKLFDDEDPVIDESDFDDGYDDDGYDD